MKRTRTGAQFNAEVVQPALKEHRVDPEYCVQLGMTMRKGIRRRFCGRYSELGKWGFAWEGVSNRLP